GIACCVCKSRSLFYRLLRRVRYQDGLSLACHHHLFIIIVAVAIIDISADIKLDSKVALELFRQELVWLERAALYLFQWLHFLVHLHGKLLLGQPHLHPSFSYPVCKVWCKYCFIGKSDLLLFLPLC